MAGVTSNADRQDVLTALATGLVAELGIDLAQIWLYDAAGDALQVRAVAGQTSGAPIPSDRLSLAERMTPDARVVLENAPVVLDPISPEHGFIAFDDIAREGFLAYAGFPLVVGDRRCGVMSLFRRSPWPPFLLDVLNALAQQAALSLEHARLLEESQALQAAAADLASTQDLRALLDALAKRTAAAIGGDACVLWLANDAGRFHIMASHGIGAVTKRRWDGWSERVHWIFDALERMVEPQAIRDYDRFMRPHDAEVADSIRDEGLVSSLAMPMFGAEQKLTGVLALYHRQPRTYSAEEVRLAQAFTNQIAVALRNLKLAEGERSARKAAARQLERLTTLTQITEQLLGITELDSVLRVVVQAAGRLCDATGAMVALIDDERQWLVPVATHGEPHAFFRDIQRAALDEEFQQRTIAGQAIARCEPVSSEDYRDWPEPYLSQQSAVQDGVRAVIAAPLRLDGVPIGMLWVCDTHPRRFAEDDVVLVQALADQAALAIEQVRLMLESREASVLEERARLARDLHDSVTQSIFSLSMLANAAETQYERHSDKLGATLTRMRTLSQEALKEMRALVFQLRPPGLEDGLTPAFERLVEASQVRGETSVTLRAATQRRLPKDTEVAVFRIAQEALNNALKHAHASAVTIELYEDAGQLIVAVRDDGSGFDPGAALRSTPDARRGGLGLHSMRERATAAGLNLRLTSSTGRGTTVAIAAPLPPEAAPQP
jgi:signal transduction histidine kinase